MEIEKNKKCNGFLSLLWKTRNDIHVTHILQKSIKTLAVHEALGKLYEALDGVIDGFAETVMAHYQVDNIQFTSAVINENPLTYVQKVYNTIEKERTCFKESFLQNEIDEIQKEISHCIYRLKHIVS